MKRNLLMIMGVILGIGVECQAKGGTGRVMGKILRQGIPDLPGPSLDPVSFILLILMGCGVIILIGMGIYELIRK